ncbi:MAG: cyclic nucleotide-binding domain-containing protein [Verrucomicrobiota bacterium]
MFEGSLGLTDLKSIGVLSPLDKAQLELMSSYGKFWKIDPEEIVLKSGESHDSLYILLDGTLEVVREDDNALLATLEPGESFGEMRILDEEQAKASATVRAKTKAAVWQMDRRQFDTFIDRHPKAAVVLIRSLAATVARRLRETSGKVTDTETAETPEKKSGWFWR